uniref:Uncharacterized protein n=1 Tax=Knipowitschia caucasica TaxID=637954 RepID=A0AAV2KC16_KNICA
MEAAPLGANSSGDSYTRVQTHGSDRRHLPCVATASTPPPACPSFHFPPQRKKSFSPVLSPQTGAAKNQNQEHQSGPCDGSGLYEGRRQLFGLKTKDGHAVAVVDLCLCCVGGSRVSSALSKWRWRLGVRTTNKPESIPLSQTPPPVPTLLYEPQPDKCSVHFSTKTSPRLRVYQEEMFYLQAIQHGNRAVMDNLEQYVGAELGKLSYEDIIKENIIGIQAEHKSCHETVEKSEEDLKKQLEGEALGAVSGMQKVREESLAFENMLSTASDIATRLESSALALQAAFTRKLTNIVNTHQ